MFDRKIYFTLLGSLTVSGFIVICTLGQTIHQQKAEAKINNSAQSLESVEFIVREHSSGLGIFRGDSQSPYKVVECNPSLFSEFDRAQLAQGIVFSTEYEVNTFIEDMIS